MVVTDLTQVAQSVLDQAKEQGSIAAQDIRAELARAGHAEARWKDVVRLIRPQLRLSKGRYHYLSMLAARIRQEKRQKRAIARAVRSLIRSYRDLSVDAERRKHQRVAFVQPVKLIAEDGDFEFLCQDLSLTGMRFLGATDLRGKTVKAVVPDADAEGGRWTFTLQVLWSSPAPNKMHMQGGIFLNVSNR